MPLASFLPWMNKIPYMSTRVNAGLPLLVSRVARSEANKTFKAWFQTDECLLLLLLLVALNISKMCCMVLAANRFPPLLETRYSIPMCFGCPMGPGCLRFLI